MEMAMAIVMVRVLVLVCCCCRHVSVPWRVMATMRLLLERKQLQRCLILLRLHAAYCKNSVGVEHKWLQESLLLLLSDGGKVLLGHTFLHRSKLRCLCRTARYCHSADAG